MAEVDPRPPELPRTIRRKAERMQRARRSAQPVWRSLLHVGSLGWLFVIPTVLGAIAGRTLGRWTGVTSLAVAPILAGVLVGGYAVWAKLRRSAQKNAEEEA